MPASNSRQKIVQPIIRMGGDAGDDIGDPGLRVEALHFGRLCHPSNYAERVWYGTPLSRWHRRSLLPQSIRHSLLVQSASRKTSRRSFGWKPVRLPRS